MNHESQYTINRMIARNDIKELVKWWHENALGSPITVKSYDWCVTNHFNLMDQINTEGNKIERRKYWSNRAKILDSILSHAFYRPLFTIISPVEQQLSEVY
jgi:hypothetical protein